MQMFSRRAIVVLLACLMLLGCTLPLNSYAQGTPNPTDYVMTLSALQTKAVMTATAEGVSGAPTEAPIPVSGGTPGTQMVTVINDTLCWRGPGPAYETISAIFKGTQVRLLGRTVLPAWYIILNPIYKDPCWIQASDVQVDQSLLADLPVYPVPALGPATPTALPTRSTATPAGLPTATPLPPTLPAVTPTQPLPTPPPPTLPAPSPTPVSLPTATPPPAPTSTTGAPSLVPTIGVTIAPTGTP